MLARSAERKREVDPSECGCMFDTPKQKEVDKIVRKHAAVKVTRRSDWEDVLSGRCV